MEDFKYCIACLATNVKMYSFSTTPFGAIYSESFQIPTYEEDQHVCFECAQLLYKYHKFKSKCHRVYNIISSIRNKYIQVTQHHIANIDRKQNRLESSLVLTSVVVCNNETYIHSDNEESTAIGLKEDDQLDEENNKIKIESDAIDANENDDSNVLFVEYLEDHFDSDKNSKTTEHKSEVIEPKTKKQKVICKPEIKQDLSDDEPLSKSISSRRISKKKTSKKKKQTDLGYFEDYATVMPLSPEDARKEVLLRKESNNYKKSPYKCDKCFRGFEVMRAFENHMIRHSIEYGKYECEFCQLRFPLHTHLCKHRWIAHKRKFTCNLCPYVCFCTFQAKTHVKLHKGTKYPCKDCGEIFSMPNSLLMHKHIKHLNKSSCECVCENCGCVFGSQRGLNLHQTKVHRHAVKNEQGPECIECGLRFASHIAWKRHLVLSTKHNVSNGCKTCGDTFPNADELKSHTRVHARKQTKPVKLPASCCYCDKWLQNLAEYKSHVTSEHPNTDEAMKLTIEAKTPFVCEICGQMFKSQCLLVYHQRVHTGERPYKCGECGKAFAIPGALTIHRATHARKRKHRCELCARYLATRSALNKHVKIHLGIRPHKCAMCDKGFIHKCDLRLHIKYVHDKVPWPKKKPKRNATEENAQYLE